MQIFRNMLMLHTAGGRIAGWCGVSDGPDGAVVVVEVQGAPPGQMEAVLFTRTGEHALGTLEAVGKSARGNWRYAGKAKEIEGIRIAHRTVQYTAKGNVRFMQKAPVMKKTETRAPKEPEAVPIPVVIEPAPRKLVMRKKETRAREAVAPRAPTLPPSPEAAAQPGRDEPWAERVGMRLFDGTVGSPAMDGAAAKGPGPTRKYGMQASAPGDTSEDGGGLFAQAGMRLQDGREAENGKQSTPFAQMPAPAAGDKGGKTMPLRAQQDGTGSAVPSWKDAPLPLMEMPQDSGAAPGTAARETGGEAEETNARIKALLERAQLPVKTGEEAPVAPESKKAPEVKKVPELIEVLSLSDVLRSGVEDGTLGAGSGKKGALGKGVWWRVEQPGVDGWHYLAGELTAKNGARVRAIALGAECDELPDHLRGWAQKVDGYFVVLIDAMTGAVLPEDAC